jgi:hypothetical protein
MYLANRHHRVILSCFVSRHRGAFLTVLCKASNLYFISMLLTGSLPSATIMYLSIMSISRNKSP